MLNTKELSTSALYLEVVYQVHTIYTLPLLHYMVLATIMITISSMRATKAMLDNGFKNNIIRRRSMPLCLQRHMFPDHKIPPVRKANGGFLQMFSSLILCIRFRGAIYKTIFLIVSYFSAEALNSTQFMS